MTATRSPAETTALTRSGLRLAQLTVGYNVVEGVLAISAGMAAGLVSMIGFGVDSGIESISAVLVAGRLIARLRNREPDEAKEKQTLKLVAMTFYLLAGYVLVEGISALIGGHTPEASPLGMGVLVASVIVMPLLAGAKHRVGTALRDPLILADAAETRICLLLSISTLAGLMLFQLTGAAWLDPVAGFVIAAFAVHEGREAWEGELVDDD